MTTATTSRPTDGSHLPVLHLNGSGAQALLAQYEVTYRALDAAFVALCDGAPHGRDYYPNGEGAYLDARAEHERRLLVVQRLRDDVMADWQIVNQMAEDRARLGAPR